VPSPIAKAPRDDARRLGPLAVPSQSADSAISAILRAITERRRMFVAFANTHLLYHALKERSFAELLSRFFLLNDGIGISLLAKLAGGAGFKENLNGTDFTPRLLRAAPEGTRVFLLGARPHVVEAAAVRIEQAFPHLNVCGRRDGYAQSANTDDVVSAIDGAAPDIVLVAMGNPRQEQWILQSADRTKCFVFVGVGALFDFLAREKPRAPRLFRIAKLEWLYRLALEPGRLWRRYTLEIVHVSWMALRQRLSGRDAQRMA
jgi:beta-1,4-glucosyltransferase